MDKGDQESSVLCGCCFCNYFTECKRCLQNVCCCCCPKLNSNKQFALIEYQPLQSGESNLGEDRLPSKRPITHLSAFRSVVSSSDMFEELPRYSQVGDDTPDFNSDFDTGVITDEPTWSGPRSFPRTLRRQDSTTLLTKPIPMKEFPPQSYSDSSHDSMEELGMEFEFVEDDDSVCFKEKPDVHIRTPESMLESYIAEAPHVSDSLKMDMSKGFTSSIRDRCYQVLPDSSPRRPSIHFSLYFYEKHHVLIVHLLKAVHLVTERSEFACNPFVQVHLLPNKTEVQESCTISQTLNPIFDQTLRFMDVTQEMLKKQTLVFRIYINDTQHFIGGVLYPLKTANLFGSANIVDIIKFDEQEGLKRDSEGDLLLSLTYHLESGTLQFVILEVCHLKKHDVIGAVNPYVKINTIYQGRRISEWKTAVKKNTLNPVFNELCSLDLTNTNIKELQIEISIKDYDRFSRNSQIGNIVLGYDVSSATAKEHWNKVFENPNTDYTFWHVIESPDHSVAQKQLKHVPPPQHLSFCVKPHSS